MLGEYTNQRYKIHFYLVKSIVFEKSERPGRPPPRMVELARQHRVHVRERVQGHATLRDEHELEVARVRTPSVSKEGDPSELQARAVAVVRAHARSLG